MQGQYDHSTCEHAHDLQDKHDGGKIANQFNQWFAVQESIFDDFHINRNTLDAHQHPWE
jgi:hypothetical protein